VAVLIVPNCIDSVGNKSIYCVYELH